MNWIILFINLMTYCFGLINSKCNETKILSECPRTYLAQKHQDVCYKAVFQKMVQEEANDYCSKDGGVLASITSSIARDNLYKMIYMDYQKRFDNTIPGISFWIGLNDRQQEGDFEWMSCRDKFLKNTSYINWGKNEVSVDFFVPNKNPSKNCVAWVWSNSPEWRTHNCSQKFAFICQIHLKPTKVSTILSELHSSDDYVPTVPSFLVRNAQINYTILAWIGIGIMILILFIGASLLYIKWKSEKQKNVLLKQTGIYPAPVDVKSTYPRQAWISP